MRTLEEGKEEYKSEEEKRRVRNFFKFNKVNCPLDLLWTKIKYEAFETEGSLLKETN